MGLQGVGAPTALDLVDIIGFETDISDIKQFRALIPPQSAFFLQLNGFEHVLFAIEHFSFLFHPHGKGLFGGGAFDVLIYDKKCT